MSGSGRYRIHAVAELTGVPEATLRAWERRYAVPVPVRTASGYRLYSPKDVEQVRRMRELCDSGVAPVDAARMVAELGQSAREPSSIEDDPYQLLSQRIVAATRRMDAAALESEVRLAMTVGDAASAVEHVYCPALVEIGRDWERGEITVGHEHLAAEIMSNATRDLLRLVSPSRPLGEVVLACFADEEHVLPVYAAGFRFVEWSYRTHVLGARTPPSAIGAAARELEPAFVGLSLTVAPTRERSRELVAGYAAQLVDRSWGVGGAAAPQIADLLQEYGGHLIAGSPQQQREQVGQLLARSSRRPAKA